MHTTLDTKEIFYIGKGLPTRPNEKARRNNYWKNIVNKHGYEIQILKSELTEDEAFELELALTKELKAINLCKANLLIGDIKAGATWNDPHRKFRQSIRWKLDNPIKPGNVPWNAGIKTGIIPWNLGKPWSQTVKNKWIGKRRVGTPPANKGTKTPIENIIKYTKARGCKEFQAINIKTGLVEWEGLLQTECIKFFGWTLSSKGNVNSCLKGNRPYHKGYIFKYII